MRRQSALFVASVGLGLFLLGGPAVSGQEAGRKIRISMTEYKFSPARITLRAGERVTLMLVNEGGKKKEHELMVGRGVKKGGPFQDRPDGYGADFFGGLAVEVGEARGVSELMAGEARVMGKHGMGMTKGMEPMKGMGQGGHGEGHRGFMVELKPGGVATLSFTVPADKAGTWEMGCFSEDGQHYQEGMKGAWEVTK